MHFKTLNIEDFFPFCFSILRVLSTLKLHRIAHFQILRQRIRKKTVFKSNVENIYRNLFENLSKLTQSLLFLK